MIEGLSRALRVILIFLMAAMTVIVAVQVVLRYFFSSPLSWGEEITRYMFIYLIFLGAASGIRHGVHVSIDALIIRLPDQAKQAMDLVAKVIVAGFLLVLAFYGTSLALRTMDQSSPALGIPSGLVYFAIPLSALIGMVFVFAPKAPTTTEDVLA